ncbi:SCO family protein [Stieleria sp. TO1_6]|uniref:SCO family protein n=1 Tax=Stieleria tagensis TaxID=2956795 RepID=UPI00209AB9F8|nr:SCO family protein [Stieleria tagensis]MCO8123169.1 SCO family protein [Stieleria tagensis]
MQQTTTQPELRIPAIAAIGTRSTTIALAAMGVWLCAVAMLVAPAAAQDQARLGPDVSLNNGLPPEAQGITVEQNLGKSIPTNLPLTDSKGRPIKTGYIINGKLPTIVTLNYSNCPMLCSVQLNKLTSSLNKMDMQLGRDFQILTVSIDPSETTARAAETKAKYLLDLPNQPGAEEGWTFATAKQPIITKLASVLGFKYRYDAANKQYNHPAMLAFVSPTGVITRYSLSIDFPPEQLKLALLDAGQGQVGSAVDQFILWCYSYDPDSNSYTPHAWKIMRLCGLGFIGLMFVTLVPYWVGRKGTPASRREDESAPSFAGSEPPSSTES